MNGALFIMLFMTQHLSQENFRYEEYTQRNIKIANGMQNYSQVDTP